MLYIARCRGFSERMGKAVLGNLHLEIAASQVCCIRVMPKVCCIHICIMLYWVSRGQLLLHACRGDAAPSTSTEGSQPQQPTGGPLPHSPQVTTAAASGAASLPAAGQLHGNVLGGPPQPAAPGNGPALPLGTQQGLDALQSAAPSTSGLAPHPRLVQLQQQAEEGGREGGGGGSQLPSLQCTLRPPSRAAAQQGEVVQRAQRDGAGQEAEGDFQFPAMPGLAEPACQPPQLVGWGVAGSAKEGAAATVASSQGGHGYTAAAAGRPEASPDQAGAAPSAAPGEKRGPDGEEGGCQTAKRPRSECPGPTPPSPTSGPALHPPWDPKAGGRPGGNAGGAAAEDGSGWQRGEEDKENYNSTQSQPEGEQELEQPLTLPAQPGIGPAAPPPADEAGQRAAAPMHLHPAAQLGPPSAAAAGARPAPQPPAAQQQPLLATPGGGAASPTTSPAPWPQQQQQPQRPRHVQQVASASLAIGSRLAGEPGEGVVARQEGSPGGSAILGTQPSTQPGTQPQLAVPPGSSQGLQGLPAGAGSSCTLVLGMLHAH